jgi:hypothetical protein
MILHQYLPLFLIVYGKFFEKVIEQLVYGVMLSHAQSHLLYKVQRHLDFSALEQACAEYHHSEGPGTPATHTVDRLLRTLVIKYLYDLSLRELEVRLYSDLLARWFVGYQLFDVLPDHSTLQRFEAWVAQEQKRLCFDEVLHQIEADYPDERIKIQIGDTYAMHAQAARENLSTLIRHTCIHVLESAVQSLPVDLTQALAGFIWTSLFGVYKQVPEFALSKEERLQRLLIVARAAYDFHSRIITILNQRPATEFPELRKQLDICTRSSPMSFLQPMRLSNDYPQSNKDPFVLALPLTPKQPIVYMVSILKILRSVTTFSLPPPLRVLSMKPRLTPEQNLISPV